MKIDNIIERVSELYDLHDRSLPDREKFRRILNGGTAGIRELLGSTADTAGPDLPAPNLLMSALERFAQKIGRVPALDVHITNPRDSERNKRKKDKLERIVTSYDQFQKLDLQLPQVARWLPGYGFAVWVITSKTDPQGNVYPVAELRDPYMTFPGYQGANQMAEELATIRTIPADTLVRMYPELKSYFAEKGEEVQEPYGFTTGI